MTKKPKTKKSKIALSIIERFDKPFEFLGVLQLLFMAWSYSNLWFFATEADARKVYVYSLLMVFEFIMVHSGVFMAVMPRKISLLVFFPFYGVFAWAFNQMLGGADNTILILYLTTVFNRMRFAFSDFINTVFMRNVFQSVTALVVYFFLVFFVLIFDPIIPEFALNEAFYQSESYLSARKHGGHFTEFPYTAIALGMLYFSLLAFANAYFIRKSLH